MHSPFANQSRVIKILLFVGLSLRAITYFKGSLDGGACTNLDPFPSLEDDHLLWNSQVSSSFYNLLSIPSVIPFPEVLTPKYASVCHFL